MTQRNRVMTDLPFCHPDRPRPRFRPLKALGHFRNLIANKEDTEQVFHIFEALPRRSFRTNARNFIESEKGKALFASEKYLPVILDDHAALEKLPANSVGRAYIAFMQREGLSAAGLVAEYDKFQDPSKRYDDMIQWYGNRQRDTHDLLHILTGYGRDALGEQCVLAFTYGQNRNWGNLLISYAGGWELKRRVKADAPVFAAIREGQRHGTLAANLVKEDIVKLLAEPLADARQRLAIGEPTQYRRAHETYQAVGIDPYDFLAAAA
ncbi:MAG: Coq4 family protein [Sphingorhabdus sp.]